MLKRSKYLVLTTEYLIPLVIIAIGLLLYLLAFHSKLFSVKTINCELDYQPCTNQAILAELDKQKGQNLLVFDQHQLESRLLSGEYTLRAVEQTRHFPSTLNLQLLSTYPVVALQQVDEPNKWITLDQNLRVIALRETDPNTPTVTITSAPSFQLGKRVGDQEIENTLKLALEISRELISVEKIHMTGDYTVVLELSSGHTALLTTARDQLAQLKLLQSILADKQALQTYHTIDVRHSQPVLK